MVNHPRVAEVVGGGTAASGVATWLNWIPDDIGKLGVLVGVVLSLVCIYTKIARERADARKDRLEIALLKIRIAEHDPED